MARKSELEEENSNIQRQMRRQDSELSDLNTKFNEKQAEYQSLKSDNQVLDREIVNYFSHYIFYSLLFLFIERS